MNIILSSLTILAVLILRAVFQGKVSRRAISALWLIAAVRLCLPFVSFQVAVPLPVTLNNIVPDAAATEAIFSEDNEQSTGQDSPLSNLTPTENPETAGYDNTFVLSMRDIAFLIYISAASLIVLSCSISGTVFYLRLRKTRKFRHSVGGISIYETNQITSPCVFGAKSVYLPVGGGQSFALRHEIGHIRHLDFFFNILRVILCAVYWFNPLVWLAAVVSKRDSEAAADEYAVRGMSTDRKLDYAKKLLAAASGQNNRSIFAPGASGGARELKGRIKMLTKENKLRISSVIICAFCAILIAAFSFVSCSGDSAKPAHEVRFDGIPDYVCDVVAEQIQNEFDKRKNDGEYYESTRPEAVWHALDWRVEDLRHDYIYEDFDGMKLDIYAYNVKFLSDNPENMLLAGGMYITDDGWYCPDYDNSRYLVFEGEKFICAFGSNDSEPGTDLFTSGLGKELYNLGLTTTDYAALEYRQTLDRYSADLQRYIDANRDLKAQIAENEQDREELLAQIAENEQDREKLLAQIAENEQDREDLLARITELQKTQQELMAQIAATREGKE